MSDYLVLNNHKQRSMIRLLTVCYFLFVYTYLNAQAVDSIPSTATPSFALEIASPFFYVFDTFYLDKSDTIMLDGNLWLPVYEKKSNAQTGAIVTGYPRLVGFTRQNERTVFYKNTSIFPREGRMYDFSPNRGDSTWIVSWQEEAKDSLLYVVDSVKYKNCIIGDSTKFMYVRALSNFPDQAFNAHRTTWVEGIGDLYHPYLPTTCLNGTCEFEYRSTKFFFDNEWLDVEEDLSCEYLVNTDLPSAELPAVKIFPNPVSAGATLKITSGPHRIDEVRIVSLASGQEVFFERFMPSNGRALMLPSVPPGVYLVRARTVTGLEIVEKVVVR